MVIYIVCMLVFMGFCVGVLFERHNWEKIRRRKGWLDDWEKEIK